MFEDRRIGKVRALRGGGWGLALAMVMAVVMAAAPRRSAPPPSRPSASPARSAPARSAPPADVARAEADALGAAGLARGDDPDGAGLTLELDLASPPTRASTTRSSAAGAVAAASHDPALRPATMPVEIVSDAEIESAIRRGVDRLAGEFGPRTYQLRGRKRALPPYIAMECGLDALCVYALMQAQQATLDPRLSPRGKTMAGLIDGLKRLPADSGLHQTYARGLRATALAVYNRPEDRAQLEEDVNCLLYGHQDGAYGYLAAVPVSSTYDSRAAQRQEWLDNSNSQYGLLGVWAGAEAGVVVPDEYWKTVAAHWARTQRPDGQWTYVFRRVSLPRGTVLPPQLLRPRISMNAAGTASALVAQEHLDMAAGVPPVGRDPFSAPLGKAMQWWEAGDNAVSLDAGHWGYTLFGIERVGLASGFKYFGAHDWYRRLARAAVDAQQPDGSWKGSLVDTAYALLFLARGRHPVMINKLRFDGRDELQPDYWNNRPRDAAYLARFASAQLERPLNWQVVPLKRPFTDWLDSPILYIASHKRPHLTPRDEDQLRQYVEWGGMIFTQTDSDGGAEGAADPLDKYIHPRGGGGGGDKAGGAAFDAFIASMAARLFPDYEYRDLPPDHALYASLYKLQPGPALKAVSNGSRLLLVHSPADVARVWQKRDEKAGRAAFELGVNLFVYAAGKRDLRNRLDSPYVPPRPEAPLGRMQAARLKYDGNWDPEPGAWRRFARLLQWDTGLALNVGAVAWKDLKPGRSPFAVLTGTAAHRPTPAELAATKAFVEAGGVMLIDDCGGSARFTDSLRGPIERAFAGSAFAPAPPDHPLFVPHQAGAGGAARPRFRPDAARGAGLEKGPQVLTAGKGQVLLIPRDLTTGLLGSHVLGVNSYAPADAAQLTRNLALWLHQRTTPAPTPSG